MNGAVAHARLGGYSALPELACLSEAAERLSNAPYQPPCPKARRKAAKGLLCFFNIAVASSENLSRIFRKPIRNISETFSETSRAPFGKTWDLFGPPFRRWLDPDDRLGPFASSQNGLPLLPSCLGLKAMTLHSVVRNPWAKTVPKGAQHGKETLHI